MAEEPGAEGTGTEGGAAVSDEGKVPSTEEEGGKDAAAGGGGEGEKGGMQDGEDKESRGGGEEGTGTTGGGEEGGGVAEGTPPEAGAPEVAAKDGGNIQVSVEEPGTADGESEQAVGTETGTEEKEEKQGGAGGTDTATPDQPGAAEPGAADPEAAEPGATDPGAVDPPGEVDPAAAEPAAVDPGAAEKMKVVVVGPEELNASAQEPSTEPAPDSTQPAPDSTQPAPDSTQDPSTQPLLDPSTQDPSMQPTLDPSTEPTPDPSTQPTPEGGMTIDGIPVLQDIAEEEPEEAVPEENREELLQQIKVVFEERDRLLGVSSQVQHEIAEYLARKKDDEKADPGRTAVDHEKKYYQIMGTLERYREELDTIKAQNQAHEAEQRALKEQKLQNLQEAKLEFVKYRREKVLNVVDQRTGKKMTVKDMEDFQAAEDKKEKDIIQVRLESIKLQNKIAKLEGLIKQKEQLVGGLHLIDFEQLKINNVDLNEKIEERNDEILKLKKKVTSTVEVLTHVKEKLQFLQADNTEKKETLREVEATVAKKRDHLTRIKRARDSLRTDNMKLRQKGGLVGHASLLRDFEERQDQSKEMHQRLETLQKRQAELTVLCDGLKMKIEQAKYVSGQR